MNCRSGSTTSSPSRGGDPAVFDSSYIEYLRSARTSVQNCVNACRTWSAPYNGEHPTVESFSHDHPPRVTASHTSVDENLTSQEKKDVVPHTLNEVDFGEETSRVPAAAGGSRVPAAVGSDSAAVAMSAFDANHTPSFPADDGITQTQEIPPSSDKTLTVESVTDEVLLAADSKLVSSSSNHDSAQPAVPPGHLAVVSATDDLESFFRQLSYVCKLDTDATAAAAGDILTEFDEVISQLDASSEDLDSQKTITPEDQVSSDFTDNVESETANAVAAESKTDSTMVDGQDTAQTLDDDMIRTQAHAEKMPASAAGNDNRDDDEDVDKDDVLQCSKSDLLLSLLQCKYELPYVPTIGTSTSTAVCINLAKYWRHWVTTLGVGGG